MTKKAKRACNLDPSTGGVLWTHLGGQIPYLPKDRLFVGSNLTTPEFSQPLISMLEEINVLYQKYNPAWADDPYDPNLVEIEVTPDDKQRMKNLFKTAVRLLSRELPADKWEIRADFPEKFL